MPESPYVTSEYIIIQYVALCVGLRNKELIGDGKKDRAWW